MLPPRPSGAIAGGTHFFPELSPNTTKAPRKWPRGASPSSHPAWNPSPHSVPELIASLLRLGSLFLGYKSGTGLRVGVVVTLPTWQTQSSGSV